MFNSEFYPTPSDLIGKMIKPIASDYGRLNYRAVLEPSAGKGNILDEIVRFHGVKKEHCYAIEIEPELRATLRGKGYAVIADDFLEFDEPYGFDLILMNPPFSNGVDHLLHAWEILRAGDIVCILNAETIKNPYTEKRKLLVRIIEQYGSVEYIDLAFRGAERKTDVECAIVRLRKDNQQSGPQFSHEGMDFDAQFKDPDQVSPLAQADALESLVSMYNAAAAATRDLHEAQMKVYFYASDVISVTEKHKSKEALETLNEAIVKLKVQFWKYVFEKTKIGQRATSRFRDNFQQFVSDTSQMAFTKRNIMSVLEMFYLNQDNIMRQCIVEVFDKATKYHEKNVVHTEGWKTNKSWKVGRKFIMPDGITYEKKWNSWSFVWRRSSVDFFNDLDRCCCFLDGSNFENMAVPYESKRDITLHPAQTIEQAIQDRVHGKDGLSYDQPIVSKYFEIRIYKKGTVHLTWRDEALLAQFNQEAAEGKHWVGAGY